MDPIHILFNRAVTGIRKQGALAYDEHRGKCYLRSPDGLACAVGQVIDDEHYAGELEFDASPQCPTAIAIRTAIAQSNPELELDPLDYRARYWQALSIMQRVHDNAQSVEDFVTTAHKELQQKGLI